MSNDLYGAAVLVSRSGASGEPGDAGVCSVSKWKMKALPMHRQVYYIFSLSLLLLTFKDRKLTFSLHSGRKAAYTQVSTNRN